MAKHSGETTWMDAIVQVMRSHPDPMSSDEIAQAIISGGLRTHYGATPIDTVGACIYDSLKKRAADSPFVKVGPNLFVLSAKGSGPRTDAGKIPSEPGEAESGGVFNAFGMFWRRELVDWKGCPRILGCQTEKSDPVDFCGQIGVYLLYDGREVIYVGRSTDRPIGIRLGEHTRDRLATRWNRFSWFGLLPVASNGKLGSPRPAYPSDALIPSLEALLIEALEPRQNRKRGDDIAATKFFQSEDPTLKKRRLKSEMARLLDME